MAVAKLKNLFPLYKKDPEVHEKFMMRLAIEQAIQGFKVGDGPPFGAAVAKDKRIVCSSHNEMFKSNDSTAHAEIVAIRKACKLLGTDTLEGCILYCSCEPCPMCLALCAMVNISQIYYGAKMKDANSAGYKSASTEFYGNVKTKDFFNRSYFKQVMTSQASIVLRQLMREDNGTSDDINGDIVLKVENPDY